MNQDGFIGVARTGSIDEVLAFARSHYFNRRKVKDLEQILLADGRKTVCWNDLIGVLVFRPPTVDETIRLNLSKGELRGATLRNLIVFGHLSGEHWYSENCIIRELCRFSQGDLQYRSDLLSHSRSMAQSYRDHCAVMCHTAFGGDIYDWLSRNDEELTRMTALAEASLNIKAHNETGQIRNEPYLIHPTWEDISGEQSSLADPTQEAQVQASINKDLAALFKKPDHEIEDVMRSKFIDSPDLIRAAIKYHDRYVTMRKAARRKIEQVLVDSINRNLYRLMTVYEIKNPFVVYKKFGVNPPTGYTKILEKSREKYVTDIASILKGQASKSAGRSKRRPGEKERTRIQPKKVSDA